MITPFLYFTFMLTSSSQKFRAYLLDSEKGMDVMAYLLCYGLEIKDKPGRSNVRVARLWVC